MTLHGWQRLLDRPRERNPRDAVRSALPLALTYDKTRPIRPKSVSLAGGRGPGRIRRPSARACLRV
ncbi:MAG: hypothetical protein ACYC61_27515 [Isosphaeraceae bacterium]